MENAVKIYIKNVLEAIDYYKINVKEQIAKGSLYSLHPRFQMTLPLVQHTYILVKVSLSDIFRQIKTVCIPS